MEDRHPMPTFMIVYRLKYLGIQKTTVDANTREEAEAAILQAEKGYTVKILSIVAVK